MSEEQSSQRKLTQAEIRRIELIKEEEEKLFAEGYKRHDVTVSIETAKKEGLKFVLIAEFVIVCLLAIIHRITFGVDDLIYIKNHPVKILIGVLIFVIANLVLMFVHEFIHALFWAIGTEGGFKNIEYGIFKEQSILVLYCNCKVPLHRRKYMIGGIMPVTILGVGLGIVGIITGSILITFIAIYQLSCGMGDMVMSSKLLQYKTTSKDVIYRDHPTELGVIVYEKDK